MTKNIIIKNDIAELEKIVSGLEEIAGVWNLDSKLIFNLNLALEELISNTIFYGYSGQSVSDQEISVEVSKVGEIITIQIIDNANAFDPIQKETPESIDKPIEEREIGGLGIYLVKNIMDEIEYKRENEQNILTLKKNCAT